MATDLTRIASACQREFLVALIEKLSLESERKVDWNLSPRQLAKELTRIFSSGGNVWPQLQNIESLAMHGGKAIVRSVLYRDQSLRNELDSLDASDETAAVWLALTSNTHFQYALSALHADRGLNRRSWKAYRAPFSSDALFAYDAEALAKFQQLVRDAIGKNRALDTPGRLEVHHFNRVVFPEHSHSRRDQDQVTVYAEMRNVTEEVFNDADEIETRRRKKIDQISVVFDRARREIDVVTIGGGKFIRKVAHAFCESFSTEFPELRARWADPGTDRTPTGCCHPNSSLFGDNEWSTSVRSSATSGAPPPDAVGGGRTIKLRSAEVRHQITRAKICLIRLHATFDQNCRTVWWLHAYATCMVVPGRRASSLSLLCALGHCLCMRFVGSRLAFRVLT